MRVGDADRALVADLLSAAYAEGRLTRDEHSARLEQAMSSRTYDDLRSVTTDLVPTITERSVGAFNASGRSRTSRSSSGRRTDSSYAVFSSVERKGVWHVPGHLVNVSLFGGSTFDFRDADFESAEVVFEVGAIFGGIDIRVPRGVNVRNETVAVFGGTSMKRVEPAPGGPTIVLKGLVLFGGVDVKGPKD